MRYVYIGESLWVGQTISSKNTTLTTNRAKSMTPQLQTSAFLPSYFSP